SISPGCAKGRSPPLSRSHNTERAGAAASALANREFIPIELVGQDRQRVEFDAFLVQRLGLVRRGLTVDRAVLDLAVVDLARLLRETRADIVGVPGDVLAQLFELLAQLAFLRRHDRDRRLAGRGERYRQWRRRLT